MECLNSVNVKKSRKQHICSWCQENINIGESYSYHVWVDFDDIAVSKFHSECEVACKQYYEENKCWGEPLPDDQFVRGTTLEKYNNTY